MTTASPASHLDSRYRSAMAAGAVFSLIMFMAEGGVGLWIGSAALIADAVNFLEQMAYCGLAVIAVAWAARARARAGVALGCAMTVVGMTALWQVVTRLMEGGRPQSEPLAFTAAAALAVNLYRAHRLAPHRQGGAGLIAIWLTARDDIMLNVLMIAAAGAIALTATGWPDIVAGLIIAAINLQTAFQLLSYWRRELKMSDGSSHARSDR